MGKIIDFDRFDEIKLKLQDKKRVLVGGCFDVLHYGHIELFRKAKEEGDYLIIALEPDEFIEKRKKRKPVHNQEERAHILSSIIYVDLVIKLPLFVDEKQYFELVSEIRPEVIAVTEGDKLIDKKREQASRVGGQVKEVTPFIKNFSSSNIINHASVSSN